MARAPLLIADTPWLLYRSHFALPKSIVDEQGRPVGALLGTVNALLAAIEACAPRAVAACLGAEEATYRVKLYEPYHAHRDPMPAELAEQWRRAPALLESLGWSVVDAGELEADDAMFSLARREREQGGEALLLSGDRDLYQAVGDGVSVLESAKQGRTGLIGAAEVRDRCGVGPDRVADLIALRGDPSDGIPGAPGIGAKTAAALLQSYGTLEGALAAAQRAQGSRAGAQAELTPRVVRSLCENAPLLSTFKQVATLVAIDVPPIPDRPTDFAKGALAARELGMKRLAERLRRMGVG